LLLPAIVAVTSQLPALVVVNLPDEMAHPVAVPLTVPHVIVPFVDPPVVVSVRSVP
jgi:hypothetical protein